MDSIKNTEKKQWSKPVLNDLSVEDTMGPINSNGEAYSAEKTPS